MGLLKRIRRHAWVATGNFASMFKEVEIPPFPAAAARLIAEINRPEPDMKRLVKVLSSNPELSAKVIQTANCALFSVRNRATTVSHAVNLLGLRHIRTIAFSFTVMQSVPRPESALFEHEAFWADSLFRAFLARAFARSTGTGDAEEAFTAMLLADVALPVLLCAWREYYEPVIEAWRRGGARLSAIERETFKWDHAQAGAWILQSWGFPEEMVCLVGVHNLGREEILGMDLGGTPALPMGVASLAPSILQPGAGRTETLARGAALAFSLSSPDLERILQEVRQETEEALGLFGLDSGAVSTLFDQLLEGVRPEPFREAS